MKKSRFCVAILLVLVWSFVCVAGVTNNQQERYSISFGSTMRDFTSSIHMSSSPLYGIYIDAFDNGRKRGNITDIFDVMGVGLEISGAEQKMNDYIVLSGDNKWVAFNQLSTLSILLRARTYFDKQYITKSSAMMGFDMRLLYFDNAATNSGLSGVDLGVNIGYYYALGRNGFIEPKIGMNYTSLYKGKLAGDTRVLTSMFSGSDVNFSVNAGYYF
ncbi:hypothetical protein ACFL4D_01260 [Candidatus Margulisiibacteriota bacterium]